MSKVNLKDNIWIEGFDDRHECACMAYNGFPLLYEGKTSKIPEELAKECVEWSEFDNNVIKYYDYVKEYWPHLTAKEAIQSACPEEYCIIYKTK